MQELTRREREVALLMMEGLSNRDIAHRMGIHTNTLKVYSSRVYQRTKLPNRTAVALMMQRRSIAARLRARLPKDLSKHFEVEQLMLELEK